MALAACTLGLSLNPASASRVQNTVTVVIHRIRAVSNFDGDFLKKDRADFYARVSVGGRSVKSPVWYGQDDARPNWAAMETGTGNLVPITIRVMDEDGGFERKDDHADINEVEGFKDLTLWYNVRTGRISGDVTGWKGDELYARGAGSDSDKAEIWFSIR